MCVKQEYVWRHGRQKYFNSSLFTQPSPTVEVFLLNAGKEAPLLLLSPWWKFMLDDWWIKDGKCWVLCQKYVLLTSFEAKHMLRFRFVSNKSCCQILNGIFAPSSSLLSWYLLALFLPISEKIINLLYET